MSPSVSRWQVKVAGPAVLACLLVLCSTGCTGDEAVLGAGGSDPAAQSPPPTISTLSPISDITIMAGQPVFISWVDTDGAGNAEVTVFYDTDMNAGNGFSALAVIDESLPAAPDQYTWNTAQVPAGTYYVGAQITDGVATATSYAPGQVTISTTLVPGQHSLDQIGTEFPGCIFEGFSFAGNLGNLMAGNFDISGPDAVPDGISDFILVAPTADAYYIQEPNVGEAYLIFGGAPNRNRGWREGVRFNVNSVGTHPALIGAIFTGPAYQTSSRGIGSVLPVQDVDGDGAAELMFGIPELVGGLWEDQDYDIQDDGRPFLYAPFAFPRGSTEIPGDDFHWFYGVIRQTGYVAICGSTTQFWNTATQLGAVIPIDEIGQRTLEREPHPRVIFPQTEPGTPGIHGMRWYPFTREAYQFDLLNNTRLYGSGLGQTDVDGDGVAEWLVAAPMTEGVGSIEFIWPNRTGIWNAPPPPGAACHSYPYPDSGNASRRGSPLGWPTNVFDNVFGDPVAAANGQLGNPVGVGDFNDDMLGDFACSTPLANPTGLIPNAGTAYLIFGRAPFGDFSVREIKNPVARDAQPGILIAGTAAGDRVGESMTSLGNPNLAWAGNPRNRDFNMDGLGDWVIGAPGRDAPGRTDAGAVGIVYGNSRLDGAFTWEHIGTDEIPGLVITGANQGDAFGTYVANGGDINGDGADDLLVAAPGAENPITGEQDTGAIYIIYGPPVGSAAYPNLTGTVSVADLIARDDIKVEVYYGPRAGARIGPIAAAGDIDADGFGDWLVADPTAAPLGRTGAGMVYVVFGSDF